MTLLIIFGVLLIGYIFRHQILGFGFALIMYLADYRSAHRSGKKK